jgi:predicted Fe-Mo cluster-binding NifX family protein
MKIVITAEGNDLSAPTSPRFGRCPTYVFVDTETMAFEAVPNPAAAASGGAGIQAAQYVIEKGAQALLTGNVGPNAVDVFRAANMPIYLNTETTVQGAVEAFKAGRLGVVGGATVPAHAGMGMGRGRGQGMGSGRGQGMGRGRGQGMAQGLNPDPRPQTISVTAREEEISALRSQATELRRTLAEVIDRIEKLEKES